MRATLQSWEDRAIRPIFEAEDFAEIDPAGKVRAQDEELRKLLDARQK